MQHFSIVFPLYVMHTFQKQHMIPSEWCHRSFNIDSLVFELLPKISIPRCILTKEFVIIRQQLHNTRNTWKKKHGIFQNKSYCVHYTRSLIYLWLWQIQQVSVSASGVPGGGLGPRWGVYREGASAMETLCTDAMTWRTYWRAMATTLSRTWFW